MTPRLLASALAMATILALTHGAARAGDAALQPSSADRNFVREAAHIDLALIGEAKVALTHAHRSDIQGFAQVLIDDFGATHARLKRIAAGAGIAVPSAPSPSDQNEINRLAGMSGTAFEQRYIADARTLNQDAVSLFNDEGQAGTYPALQYFAAHTVPMLLSQKGDMTQITMGTTAGNVPPVPPFGGGYLPPPAPH